MNLSRTYKTEGIVLKTIVCGEADRVVIFFTKHRGKVVCLAKGIRRPSSKKRGSLEIFSKVKFFANQGKGMDLVTETELLDSNLAIRKDLRKVGVAYQLCEIVDKLTAEGSESEETYLILSSYLENLSRLGEKNTNFFLNSFGENVLKALGYWPKNKPVPIEFNVTTYIEEISEREIKSSKFLKKL